MNRIDEPTPITEEALLEEPRSGFAARIRLGKKHAPLPVEFWLITASSLLLTVLGLIMVLSATSAVPPSEGSPFGVALRQAAAGLVGLVAMLVLSRLPIKAYDRLAWVALIVALALQALVFVPGIGVEEVNGNRAWIVIAGQNLQPSEFLKLAFAVWLGRELMKRRNALDGTMREQFLGALLPVFSVSVFVIGSVLYGKDLGTAMILVLILLGALFFGGVKLRWLGVIAALGAVAVTILVLTSPNRLGRITSFANADKCLEDYETLCWQPLHGLWALAGGGWFGLGLGNSREKYGWLPEAENDYIFAIVGEELGFIGCLVVLALFAVYAVALLQIIQRHDRMLARVTSGAILTWIVGQALINIAVVLQLLPSLGVPLPFMSQGGTSLLASLMATGVVLSFARTLPPREPKPARPVVASEPAARRGNGRRLRARR